MTATDYRMQRIKRIHFIGIGGAGMGGIAEVLINKGYVITGSDQGHNPMTARLEGLGAIINFGHSAAVIPGAEVVVVSSAISADNPELIAAKELRIPVVPRAEMLAELMRFNYGIAIAGTHGKTTTTSLTTSLLVEAGFDPTYVIGGKLNHSGVNASLGQGRYFVAEADESDASFLALQPMMSVVTNIDRDHMETYGGDYETLKATFVEFLHHLPFYGQAIMCTDDPGVNAVIEDVQRPVVTYGFNADADFQAVNRRQLGMRNEFTVDCKATNEQFDVTLNLAGEHNVQNALAAIALARDLGISIDAIQTALTNFSGVGRRFEIYGEYPIADGKALLLDDYGHHPREVDMVIKAARESWPERRLVVLYQPHRYTRTRDLFNDFVNVLAKADVVLLLDIYSASEQPIDGINSQTLVDALQAHGKNNAIYVGQKGQIPNTLAQILQSNDVLLTQGAGDIGAIAKHLADSQLGGVE